MSRWNSQIDKNTDDISQNTKDIADLKKKFESSTSSTSSTSTQLYQHNISILYYDDNNEIDYTKNTFYMSVITTYKDPYKTLLDLAERIGDFGGNINESEKITAGCYPCSGCIRVDSKGNALENDSIYLIQSASFGVFKKVIPYSDDIMFDLLNQIVYAVDIKSGVLKNFNLNNDGYFSTSSYKFTDAVIPLVDRERHKYDIPQVIRP